MPVRHLADLDLDYYLVCFDENGVERQEEGTRLSSALFAELNREPHVTDVFVLNHGWKGDVPAAIRQCDKWITAVATADADREDAHGTVPGWRSALVGVHWPSLPWGDERIPSSAGLDGVPADVELDDDLDAEAALPDAMLIDRYTERIADTPETRDALAMILSADADDVRVAQVDERAVILPSKRLATAYANLFANSGLAADGAVAAPGSDQRDFDAAGVMTGVAVDADMLPLVVLS